MAEEKKEGVHMTVHGHPTSPGFLHAHRVAGPIAAVVLVAAIAATGALAWQFTRSTSSPASPPASVQGANAAQLAAWRTHHRTYQAERSWLAGHHARQDGHWASHYSRYMGELTWLRAHRAYGQGRALDDHAVVQGFRDHNRWLQHDRAYRTDFGWMMRHPAVRGHEWRSHQSSYGHELTWLRHHSAYGHGSSFDRYRSDQGHLRSMMYDHQRWDWMHAYRSSSTQGSYGWRDDRMQGQNHESWSSNDGGWR